MFLYASLLVLNDEEVGLLFFVLLRGPSMLGANPNQHGGSDDLSHRHCQNRIASCRLTCGDESPQQLDLPLSVYVALSFVPSYFRTPWGTNKGIAQKIIPIFFLEKISYILMDLGLLTMAC